MPGITCFYITCLKRQINYPHLTMFKFPTDHRLEKWIINSGNSKLLYQARDKFKHKHICEEHFPKTAFKTQQRLKADAIPIPYVATDQSTSSPNKIFKVLTPSKTYSKTDRDCNVIHEHNNSMQFSNEEDAEAITNMPSTIAKPLQRKLFSAEAL